MTDNKITIKTVIELLNEIAEKVQREAGANAAAELLESIANKALEELISLCKWWTYVDRGDDRGGYTSGQMRVWMRVLSMYGFEPCVDWLGNRPRRLTINNAVVWTAGEKSERREE